MNRINAVIAAFPDVYEPLNPAKPGEELVCKMCKKIVNRSANDLQLHAERARQSVCNR